MKAVKEVEAKASEMSQDDGKKAIEEESSKKTIDDLVADLKVVIDQEAEEDQLKGDSDDDRDESANPNTIYFGSFPTKVDCNMVFLPPTFGSKPCHPMAIEGDVEEPDIEDSSRVMIDLVQDKQSEKKVEVTTIGSV